MDMSLGKLREFFGQGGLVCCSPWGHKESDTTERLNWTLQWTTFCQNSPHWAVCLGWPYTIAHSFIKLQKTVILVIILVSFLWLWFLFCLMDEDKRLVQASWWEGLSVRIRSLALVGNAMLSKSLIPFSAYGGAMFPPMVGVMVTSSKRSYASTPHLLGLLLSVSLTPCQATVDPCLCQRLPNTHRQVWVSLLWGQCSFLLGPGVHKILFLPFKKLFSPSPVEVL